MPSPLSFRPFPTLMRATTPAATSNEAASLLGRKDDTQRQSRLRRSWVAMSDVFVGFSSSALASLPQGQRKQNGTTGEDDQQQNGGVIARDYQATGTTSRSRTPPRKTTPYDKVEPKVWLANERTWIAYLNIAVLVGTMALVLFNASHDALTRYMAYAYAMISVGILAYGYAVYQKRVTMIQRKDPGHFDQILGPVLICVLLFVAILTNFLVRLREAYVSTPMSGAFGLMQSMQAQ
ncbi:hypothetical protein EXIGLDRAFT_376448 [Exidia glandulosa HHB12029]|uniref:DUF202 domain-containing protein n=1 Tax=Exidia glandulosa HHB12029 TaxID=1314781 RepID=A0A165Q082_EXIGL|nr:hypothetical protein EXIGLDRAFT_376448 [Exidia glandulosa HHB12029]